MKAEWFDPAAGRASGGGTVSCGASRKFDAPFEGDAVFYLSREAG